MPSRILLVFLHSHITSMRLVVLLWYGLIFFIKPMKPLDLAFAMWYIHRSELERFIF